MGNWTSARIETRRTDFKAEEGGKLWVEAKIKLREQEEGRSQGIWPAFWTLGMLNCFDSLIPTFCPFR